ncbi:MAG: PspA/IM30 family protein [Ferrimicrobium sp.]|jgi:phage shock protein A|uniref:PspA/IM30 family protein n=1 Tax=Ferrimicrobium sp. TaxID=2926050 RepID=UPI0026298730|nr:PspA/IM30 family protein [Ferrimicrobium sp.]MCL5973231.1 PspA/IM30 family protein [Actinomycetota bacterium]
MSMFKRVSQVFQQKSNALLDKVEDPTQAIDLSYEKMQENLQQVRRSIADVLTSQKRLEAQRAQLQAQYDKLQGQARQALQQGQEDVAKMALQRATAIQPQIDALNPQIAQLAQQESALEETGRNLNSKIEAFRAQRDTMKAQYTAAKASSAALENLTGLSDQMTDVNMMMDRAQDKISQMQSRAAAVGELANSGVLDSPTLGGRGDDIEAALAQKSSASDVDLQLAAMKAELNGGAAAPASLGTSSPGEDTKQLGAAASADTPAQAAPATGDTFVVRVLGQRRYRIASSIRPALDGLDAALEMAVDKDDADAFTQLVKQLGLLVTTNGTALEETDATKADMVLPSPDMTLDEAKKLFFEAPSGSSVDPETPAADANGQ